MAWKGLHLTQRARLSLADGQLCVKQDAGEVRIALEDLVPRHSDFDVLNQRSD
jgi:CRISP-associated protein Cas1